MTINWGQITIDLVILAVLAANMAMGYGYGLLRRMFVFAGLFGACAAAGYAGDAIGKILPLGDVLIRDSFAFVLIIVLAVILVEVLTGLYQNELEAAASLMYDRTFGAAAGLFVGLCELSLLILIATSAADAPATANYAPPPNHATMAETINSSFLGHLLVQVNPDFTALFHPVLPHDLPSHLEQA